MTPALLGAARATTSSLAGLAEVLRESVVEVRAGGSGSGSGVIWGGAGLVVTNAHCVRPNATLEIGAGGRWRAARLLARHAHDDLALLAASVTGPFLELRETTTLRAGELVFASGHPLGVRDALAMGIVHCVTRDARSNEPRWVVADIRLAPGNSGGPLVDAEQRLVGINSMVMSGLGVAISALK